MEIRKFREQDIDAVFAIQQAAYRPLYEKYHDDATNPYTETRETIFQKYTRPGTTGYVFFLDDIPVGAVRILTDPVSGLGKVSALGVLPEYQGRGIAQQALIRIEALHPEVTHWTLDTILQEEGNCHLYEKLGYARTGDTEAINDRLTLVFFEKRLV